MESFLAGCRAALQDPAQSGRTVHVVMGNEACDLDSVVSALVLGYFLAKTSSDSTVTFVPVLNIPRADFPLRTDSTFLLLQQRIPEKVLVFRDEIDLAGLHKAGLLSMTLVDHHVLPSKDAALETSVVEVVDHRPLEWERPPPCRVTAEPVGSCATLVAERLLQARVSTLDGQIAALLYGTILLDCVNMAAEAGKVTPRDARCVSQLESMFSELQPRNRLFDALQRAKFDVSGLTTEQMLRKDLKILASKKATVAISAIYMSLQDFLHRPGLEQDLAAFCHQKGFDLLIAMAISFGDHKKPFRQLAVYSPHAEFQEASCRTRQLPDTGLNHPWVTANRRSPTSLFRPKPKTPSGAQGGLEGNGLCLPRFVAVVSGSSLAQVCQALERSSNPPLGLSCLETPCPTVRAYQQGNIGASRKKLLPIVREFLHQWARPSPASPGMQPEASRGIPPPSRVGPQGAGSRDPGGAAQDALKPPRLGEETAEEDTLLPPTPMNSLVDECPLHRGLPEVSPEVIFERVNRIATDRSLGGRSPEKK